MRGDINDLIDFITKEDLLMYNKAELARRYDCDPRTIDGYLKIQSGELKPKENTREQVNTVLLLTLLNGIKTLKLIRQLYDLKPVQGFKHKLTGSKI